MASLRELRAASYSFESKESRIEPIDFKEGKGQVNQQAAGNLTRLQGNEGSPSRDKSPKDEDSGMP